MNEDDRISHQQVKLSQRTNIYKDSESQPIRNSLSLDHHLDNLLYTAVIPTGDIDINLIQHTWAQTVSKTGFFISKNSEISNSKDNISSIEVNEIFNSLSNEVTAKEIFQVLTYLSKHHGGLYKWFLLSNQNVYVNSYALHHISDNVGPKDIIYTGSVGVISTDDSIRTHLTQHCVGEGGVLLSQTALRKLSLRLSECRQFDDLQWDVGLGKCFNKTFGLACFKIFSKHFIVDKLRISKSPEELWKKNSPYKKALTITPVISSEHMFILHYFFASTELKSSISRATFFNNLVSDACLELPRSLLENEMLQSDCSAIIPDNTESEEAAAAETLIKQSIPFRKFIPADKYQYQHWQYFDPFYLYTDDNTDPYVPVKAYKFYSLELKKAIQEAVKVVSKKHHPARMKFKRLYNGYVRRDPLQGNEYIIDALFINRRRPRKSYNERVRLLRPLSNSYVLQSSKSNTSDKITIVVPISGVTQRCFEFLNMYANTSLANQEATRLVLVVYGDKDINEIQERIDTIKGRFESAEMTIVKGEGSFSRAKALHQGMTTLQKSDLAFLCDVDLTIERGFWNRCRRNTVEGKMVYYPEVFKLYNPKFTGDDHRKISRKQGHWVNYGYGMLCIFKSDYDAVGGLNTEMMGWGGEDVDFFEKVLRSKLEILQSPDVGLIHRWHPNVCETNSNNKIPCINSRAEVLGDKSELAKYIYNLMDKYPELT
jgi:hypothetical protein